VAESKPRRRRRRRTPFMAMKTHQKSERQDKSDADGSDMKSGPGKSRENKRNGKAIKRFFRGKRRSYHKIACFEDTILIDVTKQFEDENNERGMASPPGPHASDGGGLIGLDLRSRAALI
jgi:hypothetical protein